jgi:hypothetical protein
MHGPAALHYCLLTKLELQFGGLVVRVRSVFLRGGVGGEGRVQIAVGDERRRLCTPYLLE